MTKWRVLVFASATIGAVGCTCEQSAKSPDIDALRALGYVEFAATPADQNRSGATIFARKRVGDGVVLYVEGASCTARLIDVEGTTLRAWHDNECANWSNAEIVRNGDVVVPGASDEDMTLTRLSWDGKIIWKKPFPAHHDVHELRDGRLLTLTARNRELTHEVPAPVPIDDNGVALLEANGELINEQSLYDLMSKNDIGFSLQPIAPMMDDGSMVVDLFHANSVEPMEREALTGRDAIYGLENVLVSIRHQDTLAIINMKTGKLVWTWGQGVISGPHDASVLDSGNILVFDNGLGRNWSRVLEMDPIKKTIVWEYAGEVNKRFLTRSSGSSQKLSNGNVLIANSESGQIFEVTPQGNTVWEFWNPSVNSAGRRLTIIRAKKYPLRVLPNQGTRLTIVHPPSS